MAWVTPAVSDVTLLGLTAQEQTIISNGLPSGKTISDAITASVAAVVTNIRSYITLPGRVAGPDGTIPDEASIHLIPLVRRSLFGQVTGKQADQLYTEERKQSALRADEWLNKMSSRIGGIVPPTTDATDQPATADSGSYLNPCADRSDFYYQGAIL